MYNKHKTITNGKFISMSEMCEVTASYACLLEREIFFGVVKICKSKYIEIGFYASEGFHSQSRKMRRDKHEKFNCNVTVSKLRCSKAKQSLLSCVTLLEYRELMAGRTKLAENFKWYFK